MSEVTLNTHHTPSECEQSVIGLFSRFQVIRNNNNGIQVTKCNRFYIADGIHPYVTQGSKVKYFQESVEF